MGDLAADEGRRSALLIWFARAAWVALPVVAGPAAAAALDGWAPAPQALAAVELWAAWAAGLLAAFAPRPWGLTVHRIVGPGLFAAAVVAAPSLDALDAVGALLPTGLVAALAAPSELAHLFANRASYGDEVRFPLSAPPVVGFVLAPAAALVVVAGVSVGPLLLADARPAVGVPATVVGVALAVFLVRSLHALSRRWLIAVPGGLVVHDPLTVADPVLLPREVVARVSALAPGDTGDTGAGDTSGAGEAGAAGDTVDLRMGAAGGLSVELSEPLRLPVMERTRRSAALTPAVRVLVSPARSVAVLREARRRRLSVG